ncbi:MAG: amidohydrolase [Desulfobacterales bacterium]|nr:amidohydrolase [Desulfobacterales bacterium]
MKNIKPLIAQILPSMIELRRDIHAYPEPGFQEFETSQKVLNQLRNISDIQIRKGIAGSGIVATIGGNKIGPCIALRGDMDCLPIQEKTNKPYASKRPGYMHACGHDGHTACLVGAALVLSKIQDELKGPVKFIFQPSEEFDGGAQRMYDAGALENPKVDAIFGLHCYPGHGLELGEVAACRGSAMAGSGNFKIIIQGKGGHAAYPHNCIDPIYIGMQVGNVLQSIVSRSTNPIASLVVTVSKFHAGTATNIIPDTAILEGTFRSLKPKLLKQAARQIELLAKQTAKAFGAVAHVEIQEGYPVLINDGKSTLLFERIARRVLGEEAVKENYAPLMGCEDFAYYAEQIPGTFWFLGIRPKGMTVYPHCHHPSFDFNDDALEIGITMHCEIARNFAALWNN